MLASSVTFLFLLVGCGASTKSDIEEVVPGPPSGDTSGMPIDAYPPSTVPSSSVDAYPAPDTFNENAILLALNKPISPGDTTVTGVGPPGLTVYLLNITFMGEELGSGTIDEAGKFVIEVAELPSGVRIGLTADVTTVGLTENDIRFGDEAFSVPQVGSFYDSYVIRE